MKTILPSFFILLALAVPGSAQEISDPEIQQINARFSEKRQRVQRDASAHYADSLAALQKELQAAGKTAEAGVVGVELKRVLGQLNGGSGAAETATAPADMDAVFAEMQNTGEGKNPKGEVGDKSSDKKEPEKDGSKVEKRSRYDLDFRSANLSNGSYSESYWYEGAKASWKLTNLPPGEYLVRLTYRGSPDQRAGECQISIDGTEKPLSIEIAPEGRRIYRIEAGKVRLLKTGDTFLITASKVPNGKSLFNLVRVTLLPIQEGETPPAMEDDPN